MKVSRTTEGAIRSSLETHRKQIVDNGSVPLTNAEVLAHVVHIEQKYVQEKRMQGASAPLPENLAPVMGVISKVRLHCCLKRVGEAGS
jgi:hypothetical protein